MTTEELSVAQSIVEVIRIANCARKNNDYLLGTLAAAYGAYLAMNEEMEDVEYGEAFRQVQDFDGPYLVWGEDKSKYLSIVGVLKCGELWIRSLRCRRMN